MGKNTLILNRNLKENWQSVYLYKYAKNFSSQVIEK
ncbi:hypothetical protein VISI1226_00395 [Vibrio sinaloensis DSM 21326]|uniref:Uncharacterized protein n=1 Tax=Vibrio sinaloensis DSM 21326 TaxID=945550 RepID=E8M628_PHOS4|nr:hypothetical protein VISI1226_00395 [Vibrio sinaloensis DSM 21326]